MARRNGRKGDYLASDDYTGVTKYASRMQTDYWGNFVEKPLLRNLQEIASPLNDPYPVNIYRGPVYENVNACVFEVQPVFIGTTNIRTPQNSELVSTLGLAPAIPDQIVECTLIVY